MYWPGPPGLHLPHLEVTAAPVGLPQDLAPFPPAAASHQVSWGRWGGKAKQDFRFQVQNVLEDTNYQSLLKKKSVN